MSSCPAVTIVATSREPLRVEGEAAWPVAPLSLPEDGKGTAVDECEAVRLFIDRARAVQPAFSLTSSNTPAVAQICTRLDGIPLGIELAAARTRVLTVEQIAAGLADRFHLLTGGARTALPRQRTLESSVDWSHDLLDDVERVVFRRLAVFAGTFTIEAAEAVCAGDDVAPQQVLDLLGGLADRSLVQVADTTRAQTRYRLLETIRDYARHKLTDAGEAEATRDRHLDHYVSFVDRAAEGLEGADLTEWLARVDAELDNLRAALDWSVHSTDPTRGLRLVGQLCLYWFARSELAVGRARVEATLDGAGHSGLERGYALGTLCMIAYRAGDMASARRYGDEAVELGRRLDDARLLGRALHARAWVRFWGEADGAGGWADFEEAAALLRQTDDRVFRVLNLTLLAWSCTYTSEVPRARAMLDEALALADVGDVPHARCYCHVVLGQLEFLVGDLDRAAVHLDDALTLVGDIGDHYAEIFARAFLGYTEVFRGRYRNAREQIDRALTTALEHRSPNGEGLTRGALGLLEFAEGNLDAAAAELQTAFGFYIQIFPALAAIPRSHQAQTALARGAHADARHYAAEALDLGTASDTTTGALWALVAQADLARLDGDAHAAEDLCHEALELACRVGSRLAMCDVLDALGGAVTAQDRYEEAARLLGAAQSLRDTLGAVRFSVLQPSHDAVVAAVRHALGPEPFDDAWADGEGLSLDDALSYARRGRGRRKRPGHGWQSLTPTEVQVVELVAEGLTNPQIGERLFISRRTVQTHLAHVFTKLGVSTRAELAAITAQRQTVQQ
jgi:predicted ATPase/DNA-binding CsgD family transcriptional regulator